MPDTRARLFWSGRSQAVRLPKAFRIDAREVRIRREGNTLVLEPVPTGWEWLASVEPLDADAGAAALEDMPWPQEPEEAAPSR
jgi:antitoxin VapB